MTTPRTLGELIRFASDPFLRIHHGLIWDGYAEGGLLAPARLARFNIPDLDRLEAVAQAAWGEPLTLANLRRIRGQLITRHGITPDGADAMALALVATRVVGDPVPAP